MRSHASRRASRRSGQALVEFALVVPILMLIVLGIIEFGQAWRAKQAIGTAAWQAARLSAIVDQAIDQDSVRRAVNRMLAAAGLDSTKETLTLPLSWHSPGSITVQIEYPYHMGWLQGPMSWTTGQASLRFRDRVEWRSEW